MLGPVELSVLPSCYDCLSWSADGEIAVAAGEHVQILTPKPAPLDQLANNSSNDGAAHWNIFKIQTNLFTSAEWPTLLTQPGEVFSIGEEQSIGHVVALSWSQPGLGAYRRCVLAVLTSNLVLSLWHAQDGHSRWIRVAVVNQALNLYFESSNDDSTSLRLKQRIRSFSWAPANTFLEPSQILLGLHNAPTPRGRHLLAVTNDHGDVIFLEAFKHHPENGIEVQVLATHQFSPLSYPFPNVASGSLLAASLKAILKLAWGPWVELAKENGDESTRQLRSTLALIRGSELNLLHLTAVEQGPSEGKPLEFNLELREMELPSFVSDAIGHVPSKSHISWMGTGESICLVVGILDGFITIRFGEEQYRSPSLDMAGISVQKHDVTGSGPDSDPTHLRDWQPITGVAATFSDQQSSPWLHATSLSSRTACLSLATMETIPPPEANQSNPDSMADWQSLVRRYRTQFDAQYDLRGASMAKIWGLASYGGWIAACFTLHPTDTFDHSSAINRPLRIVFSHVGGEEDSVGLDVDMLPWRVPDITRQMEDEARARILAFTLSQGLESHVAEDPYLKRLQYAAACCVTIDSTYQNDLRLAAMNAMRRICTQPEVDWEEELGLMSAQEHLEDGAMLKICPKSKDQLCAPGAADVFEKCDICDSGIEWYSPCESRCAEGHYYVRCGVTFLSIQDPYSSRRCARCGKEVLKAESIREGIQQPENPTADAGMTFLDVLLDRFDTCEYCGGKFRA